MNTLERLIESDDHIELMEHILPTRSVLYNLEPVGVGTPYAESLTSYISRLASIHNLPISIFIESLIAPILSSNIVKRGKSGVKYTEMSKYINGNTTITTGYINTIEKLTSRNDIQYLTMNNWKGIFPNNIIDVHRKWCPLCLNSMKTESEIIYEPLIWYIAGVSKCTIHEITLHNKCPYCQKQVPYLMKNFMVGHCPYCFKWFGSKKPQLKESLTQKEDFISKNFMELIMKAPFSNSFPSRKSIGIVLNKIKEELDFKYISELAKFLETDKRKSYSWSNSKVIPQPEQLMNIAEKTKSSIYYLFCNNKFELNVDTSSINR